VSGSEDEELEEIEFPTVVLEEPPKVIEEDLIFDKV